MKDDTFAQAFKDYFAAYPGRIIPFSAGVLILLILISNIPYGVNFLAFLCVAWCLFSCFDSIYRIVQIKNMRKRRRSND